MEFITRLRGHGIDKPCVAIGGIDIAAARQLRRLGADGVAVISAITRAQNIGQTVRLLKSADR